MSEYFDVPEEDRDYPKKSPYATRKQFYIMLVVALAVVVAVPFLIRGCKEERDWVVSKENLRVIGSALRLYSEQHDDGLPPIAERSREGIVLDRNNYPVIWASQVYGALVNTEALKNPKVSKDWSTIITIPGKSPETIFLGYGMLTSLDTVRIYEVTNTAEVILIAETISGGFGNSLNPLPLGVERDGFAIGYNNSNDYPNEQTEFATRLAFLADEKGTAIENMKVLHPDRGTLSLNLDGSLRVLSPIDQKVGKVGRMPRGIWVPIR